VGQTEISKISLHIIVAADNSRILRRSRDSDRKELETALVTVQSVHTCAVLYTVKYCNVEVVIPQSRQA
jgi:hypothetical protein